MPVMMIIVMVIMNSHIEKDEGKYQIFVVSMISTCLALLVTLDGAMSFHTLLLEFILIMGMNLGQNFRLHTSL